MTSEAAVGARVEVDQEQYDDTGVVVLPRFLDTTSAAALEKTWHSLKHDFAAASLERNARFLFGSLPDPIGQVYAYPPLVSLARSLVGPDVALYMNRILLKDEHWGGAVAIHQDMPYFNGGHNKVSIFVPLTPTRAQGGNGGLVFIAGSHKYGNLQRGTIDRAAFEPMEEIGPDLQVGDIVVMNFFTWHYSEDAVVHEDRPLLQIVYQSADDGSFGGSKLGVPQPTLVCGEWKTRHFAEWGRGVIPDA
jgi:hypothetical protein